jgi:hypothetical protein
VTCVIAVVRIDDNAVLATKLFLQLSVNSVGDVR